VDPYPDPGGQKLPTKIEKINFMFMIASLGMGRVSPVVANRIRMFLRLPGSFPFLINVLSGLK
jgi:hypothetical protein